LFLQAPSRTCRRPAGRTGEQVVTSNQDPGPQNPFRAHSTAIKRFGIGLLCRGDRYISGWSPRLTAPTWVRDRRMKSAGRRMQPII
jgi:hypothetical protein